MTPTRQTIESRDETLIGVKRRGVSVCVTAETDTVSTKTIASNSLDTTNDLGKDTVATIERILSHNQETIQQNELEENHASLFLEIQKPPTPVEAERGIVYVEEHELGNGLFKIGWREDTARVSITPSDSCNKLNSKVIYETPGGPFLAASKVKQLSLTALHPQILVVMERHHGGRGYEEWISAPLEKVLQTIKTLENFVKLPAYESKDGQNWELSFTANKIIRGMDIFLLENLEGSMNSTEGDSAGNTVAGFATGLSQETVTCVAETAASPTLLDTEEELEGRRTLTTPDPKSFSKESNSEKMWEHKSNEVRQLVLLPICSGVCCVW
ncbi:uncharacterized protein GLRG_11343 [Colletotrichum graminicola M1.001]|uniref:Uncharacterized protein n=1 Tax=Colletotrichum graminicola (strain M1.001 / M2 / FGSC 10212) TaxID=645133 RepID=E3QZB0_COLGM|nr:uncharacterized protein GLRG_11343 [Colletotrichum graminicola M1.001]EFQ36198.1 hypothetical protein GLRG_11343 [Colletotrichum graminicola M1.001]